MIQPPGGDNAGLNTTFKVQAHAVDLSKQPWVSKEFKITRSLLTYKNKLYGQTIWDTISGSWVIVYNKTDFTKAGIKTLPTTFKQLTADCAKLKAKHLTPFFEPADSGSSWHPVLWFNENLSKAQALQSTLDGKLNANTTTFAANTYTNKAMTQVNSLYQSGYFGSHALTNDYGNAVPAMGGGTYAMMVANLTLPTQIHTAMPSVPLSRFGFMPVPILDNQYINQNPGGPSKLVYKQGAHVAAAEEYLNFLGETANLNYLIAHEPTVVTYPWKGVKAKWTPEQKAFEAKYKPSPSPVGQVSINYDNPQWGSIGTDMVAMFTGAYTPLQVLQNIDTRRAQQAHAAGDPHWP
jgi:raffinose/stachyose/melibiose transport system substrate-binding protein